MNVDNILKNIPDKRENKHTTSLKFKRDLIDFFDYSHFKEYKSLEVGTAFGHTTRVLSFLFKEVNTLENYYPNILDAKELNKDRNNINYYHGDAYESEWEFSDIDVVFIDCKHDYKSVIDDIHNSIKVGTEELYIIFDDYGLPQDKLIGVKNAVDECVTNNIIRIIKYIGEPKGSDCRKGKLLETWEGVICQLN